MRSYVVVTGSDRGSKIAWNFIKFALSIHKIKAKFISPSNTKYFKPENISGVIISGGIDIDPSTYGKNPKDALKSDKKRDELELKILDFAVDKNLPLLGICRGMQLINIFFGGTLHLDIFDLDLNHPHPKTPLPLKDIYIEPHSNLYKILKTKNIKVNALHHQAVEKLGIGLKKVAFDKNRIIQAIEHESLNIIGLQWHPEFMLYSSSSFKIFNHFIKNIKI